MRRVWTGASVNTKKKNSVFNERTQAKLMRKKKRVIGFGYFLAWFKMS